MTASDHGDRKPLAQQVRAGRDAYVAGRDVLNIYLPRRGGKVAATVSAFQENPPSGGWTMEGDVRYESRVASKRLVISPRHPYLEMASSGAALTPQAQSGMYRPAGDPKLDIKVVNNTSKTVIAHHVKLEVKKSGLHCHSVPLVQEGKVHLSPSLAVFDPLTFMPTWPIGDATIDFQLEHPAHPGPITSHYTWRLGEQPPRQGADHLIALALAEAGAHPIEDEELARQNYLRKTGALSELDPKPIFHSRLWRKGPFADGLAIMMGTITYTETNIDGIEKKYSNHFRTPIRLEVSYPPPPRPMRIPVWNAMPPSAHYSAPELTVPKPSAPKPALAASGTNYTIDIPISHSLTPGEADRFLIALPTRSASTHDFRVVLQTTAGDVECGTVRLESYFRLILLKTGPGGLKSLRHPSAERP